MKAIAHPCLSPVAYCDPRMLDVERQLLLKSLWQWAGLLEDTRKPGGLTVDIAETPISIEETSDGSLKVNLAIGSSRAPLTGAMADRCGRFVFVLLVPAHSPGLREFLGDYALVLDDASQGFEEVFLAKTEEWACNWKAGIEIALEGYHVPFVHGADKMVDGKLQKKSNFADAIPSGTPPRFEGPHSMHIGLMSPQMRDEMANIAKRLKISPHTLYTDYNHYTIFPNMMLGFSGGCLMFMQIYSPMGVGRSQLRYAYILAKPIDPEKKPVQLIKNTLLNSWRDYTALVLEEDRIACENFQRGVVHATKTGCLGRRSEKRVRHFQKYWRKIIPKDARPPDKE